jgi:hypothetical protein
MPDRMLSTAIDLDFRPASYFWPLGLETHLLATVKGAERKAALQQLIATGQAGDIPDFLAKSALSDEERQALGRIHPAFMGGEYLPDLHDDEIEIARIVIASTTWDVTSVFARRDGGLIHYRVVDEYNGSTLSDESTRTSEQPLTLRELEAFLNGAWSIYDVLDMNFGDGGGDVGAMLAFVSRVESQFYPMIGQLYNERIADWAQSLQDSEESDDVDA